MLVDGDGVVVLLLNSGDVRTFFCTFRTVPFLAVVLTSFGLLQLHAMLVAALLVS